MVWDWFARFTTFVDEAAALRVSPQTRLAPGRERQLADFLTQPSIELPSDEIPMRDRDLLQHRRPISRCTPDELLDLMSGAFARAREVVTRIGAAWDDLAPRVARARTAILDADGVETTAVQQRLDALTEALVTDPLSVTEVEVGTVEEAVGDLTRSAEAARQLRDEFAGRLRDARAELARVEQDAAVARAAHATAIAKIVGAGSAPPPAVDGALAVELDHVVDLADAARWHDAAQHLDRWHVTLRQLADAAAASSTASRAPLIQRDQLRGRLDAYRAKAHGLGLDEDRDLSEAYERAQGALYAAPADLAAANELVEQYHDLLSTDDEPEARR
jgi:hypothetical protein